MSRKRTGPWRSNRHPVAIGILAVVIILGIGLYFLAAPALTTPNSYPFPCLGNESLVYHVHPYLRVVINGQNVTIPAAIGIHNPFFANGVAGGGQNSCFEPLHTHDTSGVIHIESESGRNYTLGDFFTVWRDTYPSITINGVSMSVTFNSSDILGFKADSTHTLQVLVDGKPYQGGDPTALVLDALDYCSAATTTMPCYPTAVGSPEWNGLSGAYPYGTGHTIEIVYGGG